MAKGYQPFMESPTKTEDPTQNELLMEVNQFFTPLPVLLNLIGKRRSLIYNASTGVV